MPEILKRHSHSPEPQPEKSLGEELVKVYQEFWEDISELLNRDPEDHTASPSKTKDSE